MDGKLDTENNARKTEIANLDNRTKSDNEARKSEIANLDNFAKSENTARKDEIANLNNFARSENDGRIKDISDLNSRYKKCCCFKWKNFSPISYPKFAFFIILGKKIWSKNGFFFLSFFKLQLKVFPTFENIK